MSESCFCLPLDDVLLLLDGLAQRVAQRDLGEVLQRRVDGVTDGVVEHALHAAHQHLQPLYHGHHLQGNKRRSSMCDWRTSG